VTHNVGQGMGSPDSETARAPLSIVVLTHNEERNLEVCLESVAGWAGEMFVVDSGSTDSTPAVAKRYGAAVFSHPFIDHRSQWSWAMENLPLSHDWVFGLDADQRVTPELRGELLALFSRPASLEGLDGLYVCRRQVFRGQWIRHGGYYPKYLLKLFRRDRVYFDPRDLVDHHFFVRGATFALGGDIVEDNQKERDIAFWIEKHNRYAVLHAREEMLRGNDPDAWPLRPSLFGGPDQRVMWLKRRWYGMPLYIRPILYFVYRFLIRRGFLDGRQGFVFHVLHGFWYRLLIDIHLDDMLRESEVSQAGIHGSALRHEERTAAME